MNTTTRTAAIEAAIDGTTLTLSFAHGKAIVIDASTLPQSIIDAAVMHGLKQKLVDAAAISRDTDTGRTATVETKFAAVGEVAARLLAGEWNKSRASGGPATGGLLIRALLRMYDGRKTKDELVAFLSAKTDAEKTALRKSAKVAPIIAELRDEDADRRGAGGVDVDDLLGELGD